MIKTVFFDFDGVLTTDQNDSYTICRYLASKTSLRFDQLYAAYSPYRQRLYSGKITNESIWSEFVAAVGQPIAITSLYESFAATPKNVPMFSLAQRLKSTGYNVGIITNQTLERYESLRDPFQLNALFDPVVVSAVIGATKAGEFSDKKIFEIALARHANTPGEAIFIDNTEANLEVPKRIGIHTIYHDDAKNDVPALQSTLQSLGVRIS